MQIESLKVSKASKLYVLRVGSHTLYPLTYDSVQNDIPVTEFLDTSFIFIFKL